MAKHSAKIDDVVAARRREIESALNDIIDNIEKYFLVSPFQFIETENADPAEYCFHTPREATPFNRFFKWNDLYMGKLFPDAHEAQRKLEERGDHEDEPGELAFAAQRFGFVVGVLVGMRTAGFSREELTRRAEGFVHPLIDLARSQARYEADRAERAEKGEVNRGN